MADYIVSRPARRDLREIREQLKRDAGLRIADYVEDKILAAFDDLATLPAMGHRRSDITVPGLWFHVVFQYVIAFRRQPGLVIVRVVHGARDLSKLLQ